MEDLYINFTSGVQALRRQTEALTWGMGGALGVAADPYPHQLSTVGRILTDTRIRHLIADEVGLGKTVQALMIINALRWQNPNHRTVVLAPDRLIGQWQTEAWTRGHLKAAVVGFEEEERLYKPNMVLVRPRDIQDGIFKFDLQESDLLVIDEPQSIQLNVMEKAVAACSGLTSTGSGQPTADGRRFRQVLVLSATPKLSDPAWREKIYEIIEPERAGIAKAEGKQVAEFLRELEIDALQELERKETKGKSGELTYLTSGITRRITRQSRKNWSKYLPERKNITVTFDPTQAELERLNISISLIRKYPGKTRFSETPWTTTRDILRSRRSARTALSALNEPQFVDRISKARELTINDPGDSRFEALLDVLSSEWSSNPDEKFIVVAGDAATIDMLNVALPRYLVCLAEDGAISSLKRPPAVTEETAEDIRQMHEAVQPFINGAAKLLLLGDWVQAGLNLHHSSRNIVFYSLPWDPQAVDQLIGRIDRLRRNGLLKGRKGNHFGYVRIWRLVMRNSPEEAISRAMNAIRLFDRPLPQLSEEDSQVLHAEFEKLARNPDQSQSLDTLVELADALDSRGMISKLSKLYSYSFSEAIPFGEEFKKTRLIEPSMGMQIQGMTPVEQAEISNMNWVKLLMKSGTFSITRRSDKVDPKSSFWTIWYAQSRSVKPFPLTEIASDYWMTNHAVFHLERGHLASPPRAKAITDAGEEEGRLLRFFDHGEAIHDDIVNGFIRMCTNRYAGAQKNNLVNIKTAADHPVNGLSRKTILLSVGHRDLGLALDCETRNADMEALIDEITTDAQRARLLADASEFFDDLRSDQRWIRSIVPAALELRASQLLDDRWIELDPAKIPLVFKPLGADGKFTPPPRTLLAKGRHPTVKFAERGKAGHMTSIQSSLKQAAHLSLHNSYNAFEQRFSLIDTESKDLIELRRKQFEGAHRKDVAETQLEMYGGQLVGFEKRLLFAEMVAEERKNRLFQTIQRIPDQPATHTWHLFVKFVPDDA